ncbi:response regulator transcription factor [Kitasatospora sp. NA04385]|uniref:response regulator transcription factor n=1 Tax=Kitasatospora sp. NA04385 TaxID=2742135 RepID=UPI0015928B5B|nr:response regulator transcription factor [Kitasatospora sp. NA04385]QKW19786.1 response regulator transcription factor [Kitasatospora sp. NA04385]
MAIRVVIVDDQHMIRAGFRALLDAEPDIEVVGEASDGDQVPEVVASTRPDVVLMDVRMPTVDGLTATRELLTRRPDDPSPAPRVIMLTTFDLDEYVYEALRSGASGFLLKHAPPRELPHAVRTVADGNALIDPQVLGRLVEDFVRSRVPLVPRGRTSVLTERETEVLVLLARGLSNTEIAARLVVAEQTVKTHVSRIFAKLGVRDRAQAVIYAYETGLIVPGSGPQ